MQDGSKSYFLGTGDEASKRLDLQHEIFFGKLAFPHLEKAGLKEGHTVFDIGCGSGVMTLELAKRVGKKGHVYGIDISQAQLDYAKRKIENAGLNNVTFIKDDITDPKNLPENVADLIYIRLVLMHLKDPTIAIENMKSILKPGGIIASLEGYNQRACSNGKSDVMKRVMDLLFNMKKHNGLDYNVAKKIEKIFEEGQFSHIESYETENKMSAKDSVLLAYMSFSEWSQKAVDANLVDKEEARNLEQTLADSMESNEDTLAGTLKYVIAKK